MKNREIEVIEQAINLIETWSNQAYQTPSEENEWLGDDISQAVESLKFLLNPNKFLTTRCYWDCDCTSNYIHHMKDKDCQKCRLSREEGADSRILEVKQVLDNKTKKRL